MNNSQQQEQKISDIVVNNENTALNVLVNFITIAQKRGVYSIEESAKIWECIKIFMKSQESPTQGQGPNSFLNQSQSQSQSQMKQPGVESLL
jgi:hypothetical protein